MNINARSILPKSADLEGLLLAYNPDMTVITETWLHDNVSDEDIVPRSHEIIRHDRGARGGGVAVVLKKNIEYTVISHNTNVEMLWIRVRLCQYSVFVGAIYRPPDADLSILEKLHDFMYEHCKSNANVILCGDLNLPKINWDLLCVPSSCQHSELMLDIAFSFRLKQLVDQPTRVSATSSTVLDLFFVSENISAVGYDMSYLPGLSDHDIVLFAGRMRVSRIKGENVTKNPLILTVLKMRVY